MNALSCTRIEAEIEISTVFFKILKVKRKNVFLQNEDKINIQMSNTLFSSVLIFAMLLRAAGSKFKF